MFQHDQTQDHFHQDNGYDDDRNRTTEFKVRRRDGNEEHDILSKQRQFCCLKMVQRREMLKVPSYKVIQYAFLQQKY